MVRTPEDSSSTGPPPESGRSPEGCRDPIRHGVQLALALYLSPILLVICLIGGVSLLAGGLARAAGRWGRGLAGPEETLPARLGGRVDGRPATLRRRSHAAH